LDFENTLYYYRH